MQEYLDFVRLTLDNNNRTVLLLTNDPMETGPRNPVGEETPPAPEYQPAPLDVIRTETVLSKLPVHNLAKKGKVNIQISKTGLDGKVELKWEVSYSERYGQARALAYKLDTIVIDPIIEEAGRPLPPILKLGSLRQFCEELGLAGSGKNFKDIKRAFHQNASAYISAKVKYKGNDGVERDLEAGFTRYSVIFTGEKLPDGSKADAVHIAFSPPYQEVLNNAPIRPLDLGYKKQLHPAAQRFYEIVSYKIFAALKYNQLTARLAYSEYCTFSAQQRYFERQPAQNQMNRIHREHKKSGYITGVQYQETTDQEGKWDCVMHYTPGPKARAEYAAFTNQKLQPIVAAASHKLTAGESAPVSATRHPRQRRLSLVPADDSQPQPASGAAVIDYSGIIAELAKRGVGEIDARQLLSSLPPDQPVLDLLEYGDRIIAKKRGQIANPPGFYISLLQRSVPVPPSFISSRKKKELQEAESARRQAILEQQATALTAEEAEAAGLNAQIEDLPSQDRLALLAQAKADLLTRHPHPDRLKYYFKTHPEAEGKDGAIYSRARTLLKEGWIIPGSN